MTIEASPLVSVVICTRNRKRLLARALQSIIDQSEPSPPWEVIVVDNASEDGTAEIVRRQTASGRIRYVFEPLLGLCHARNTGWRNARGRYVAYLDDDAVAGPDWIAAVVEAFASTASAGVVGGRVTPDWEGPRPEWLSDEVAMSLTIVDWSPSPKIIHDLRSEWLVGANMAVRADVIAQIGGFRVELDRSGTGMLSSGDVFLQKQVAGLGHVCLYYPAMAVRHLVPLSRLNKAWFRRRYYWQGISDVVMEMLEHSPSRARRLASATEHTLRLLRSPRRLAMLLPTNDPVRFTERCWGWIEVGRIAGLLGAGRG